jgi:hypothetical protein
VCNRGAKGKTTGKRASVNDLTRSVAAMTCTQPRGEARAKRKTESGEAESGDFSC